VCLHRTICGVTRAVVGISSRPGMCDVPWGHAGMDRLYGALQALEFVRSLQWPTPAQAFDSTFSNQE
jgi:hypothetical protein